MPLFNLLGLVTVRTPQQLDALSMQTYLIGALSGVIFLLIAALISNSIKFEGGAYAKDPRKRRMWFWALLIISVAAVFLYNMFLVAPTVSPNLQSRFMSSNVISTAIDVLVYIILGFIISKVFSTGKLGNWFPSKK